MRWKKPEPRPQTYWQPWFAWRPIVLENTGEKVWLEWVWRHDDVYRGGFGDHIVQSRYRSDVHWAGANLDRKGDGWPNALSQRQGERS